MEKAYKYRIYPNKKQKEMLAKTFGCCRFVYNHYLDKRMKMYETDKETFTYVQCANDMKHLKSELGWLKEVVSTALQSSLRDQEHAYQKFFKEQSGYPKFKSKKTLDLCQYFGQKKLKDYAAFLSSSYSFCCGVR